MHPAPSVIFFTTFSGAGYGLLALLGILGAAGVLPADRWLGAVGVGIALVLITAGLLASMLHLGRPERAWRAFSQWRSSWLSREGVASLVAYVPAVVFGIGWALLGRTDGVFALAGVLAAIAAAATVFATGMIYASLKPIAQWASPFTVPAYLIFAAMTGASLLHALVRLLSGPTILAGWIAFFAALAGWGWKAAAWNYNRNLKAVSTANSATGLSEGVVRSLEWPHTENNYLLKEMGYRVARKHAERIRAFAHIAAFAVPALLTALALASEGRVAALAAIVALLAQMAGMLAERWLFFAEAEHTVILYYQR